MDSSFIDETCGFCTELHEVDNECNLFNKIIMPRTNLKSRIILETNHFVVMPTIGAFVDGYVLIVSKEHFVCIGKMSQDALEELKQLIIHVKKCISDIYDMNTVCFEHGGVSCAKRAGGCIVHAHMHLVPCDSPIVEEVRDRGLTVSSIVDFLSLQEYAKRNMPYLFFEDADGQKYILKENLVISQFFRQLLARHFGLGTQWDWRQHLFLDNMVRTVKNMSRIQGPVVGLASNDNGISQI